MYVISLDKLVTCIHFSGNLYSESNYKAHPHLAKHFMWLKHKVITLKRETFTGPPVSQLTDQPTTQTIEQTNQTN